MLGSRTLTGFRRLTPLSTVASTRWGAKTPSTLVCEEKKSRPFPRPASPYVPPEAECLRTVGLSWGQGKPSRYAPHPPECHSTGNNQWGIIPTRSRHGKREVHDRQQVNGISVEGTPMVWAPPPPNCARGMRTSGTSRELNEVSRAREAQSGHPLVFGDIGKVMGSTFLRSFAPPPPQLFRDSQGGGG